MKIIWITGNSGSGKTTLAHALKERLYNCVVLDGDTMRRSISLGTGFSKEAREEHNLRVARLARELMIQGFNVIVSVIAPFQSTRYQIDEIIKCDWVYIKKDVCNGTAYPYEPPINPIVTLESNKATLEDMVEQIIEKLRLFSIFVLGLPRSGTSMMTRIVELLGVNMVYTSEESDRRASSNDRYEKRLGEYHPNKSGFYEITRDAFEHYDNILSTPYSGCKLILPIKDCFRRRLIRKYPSKIILMHREPEEIRQSQEAYKIACGEHSIEQLRSWFGMTVVELRNSNINFIKVEYRDVLKDKTVEITRIKRFIRSSVDIAEAVSFVNPEANRFKMEELNANI